VIDNPRVVVSVSDFHVRYELPTGRGKQVVEIGFFGSEIEVMAYVKQWESIEPLALSVREIAQVVDDAQRRFKRKSTD
jgi:hypothetical protein